MKFASTRVLGGVEVVAITLPLSTVPKWNPEAPVPGSYLVDDDVQAGWIKGDSGVFSPPPLAHQRDKVWDSCRALRDKKRFEGGVKVGEHWFLSTQVAMSEYASLALLSASLAPSTVLRSGWRTMSGATVDMTPSLVGQIMAAGFAQVAAIDDAAQAHKAAIYASADPTAYDFSSGWPAVYSG